MRDSKNRTKDAKDRAEETHSLRVIRGKPIEISREVQDYLGRIWDENTREKGYVFRGQEERRYSS